MINPFKEINWNPGKKDIRTFGHSMLIGCTLISLIFLASNIIRDSLNNALTTPVITIFLAGILLFIISKMGVAIAKPFYLTWYFLAASIGIVISNILLMLFYYCFFSLFAVIFRTISGRDPLLLKKDTNRKSWWHKTEGEKSLRSYFKQY